MTDVERGVRPTHPHLVRATTTDGRWFHELDLGRSQAHRSEDIVLSSVIRCPGVEPGVDESADLYSILIVLTGRLVCDEVDEGLPIAVGRGIVASPTRPIRIHASAEVRLVAIRIEQPVLESEVSGLLGHAVPWPVVFEPAIDVTTGLPKVWYRMALSYLHHSSRPERVRDIPGAIQAMQKPLIIGLLRAQRHNYVAVLDRGQARRQFQAVRSAVDRMSRRPHSVSSIGELARDSGTSVRSLQEGFHRFLGVTPSEYLRRIRSE